jgi:hypothetical protein
MMTGREVTSALIDAAGEMCRFSHGGQIRFPAPFGRIYRELEEAESIFVVLSHYSRAAIPILEEGFITK